MTGGKMLEPLPELDGPEHSDLVDRLVPASGSATTVQGEVLRATLRLKAEFFRNGCGNWQADPQFFDGFVAFLLTYLCDETFGEETKQLVQRLLAKLQAYGYCDYNKRSREDYLFLDKELAQVQHFRGHGR
jgi:hypothetical protein